VQEASLVGLDTDVEHEDVSRLQGLPDAEIRRSFDIVSTIAQFGSPVSVQALTEFVCRTEVT